MRSLTLVLIVLSIILAPPSQAGLEDLDNAIGLYTEVPSDFDEARRLNFYEGDPGTFQVYVVMTRPYNEFRLELPSTIYLLDAVLPSNSANYMSPPDFFVGTNVPVSSDMGTLGTLTLGEFTGGGGEIFLAPVSRAQSIPGEMAVADFDDDFSLSRAVPASGDFGFPVFCVFCQQYAEGRTWGDVKSLYR
jgi:hypothetical protein